MPLFFKKRLDVLDIIYYAVRKRGRNMTNFKSQAPTLREKLRKAIRVQMDKSNISQADLGRTVGMDRRNVNKTLCGTEKRVSMDQLIRLANGAGLKIDLKISKSIKALKNRGKE